jgi:hypothetical protein
VSRMAVYSDWCRGSKQPRKYHENSCSQAVDRADGNTVDPERVLYADATGALVLLRCGSWATQFDAKGCN